MLRIISGLLLLIISQFSFASLSTTNETIPASYSPKTVYYVYGYDGPSYYSDTPSGACSAVSGTFIPQYYCRDGSATKGIYQKSIGAYSCPFGYTLSDSSGNANSAGRYCTKREAVDSCASYAGQSGYFWVNKVSPPSTICSGTCLASASVVAGFPDADPLSWQYLQYTYTGATSGCTADSGFTDDATAAADNAAAAEKDRLTKVQKAIDDAITACGGVGFYTTGTFNGQTVVTCINQDKKTTSTTTTTVSGSSSTTTNDSTTANNNGKTTTVNSDGSTSTSGGTTTTSGHTTTTITITNPDGSTTTTTTASGATGTCDQSDMKYTAGCAELGEAGDGDSDALEESSFDWGFTEQSAFGGAADASCPSSVVIMSGVEFKYDGICQFLRGIRPFILAVAYIVAAMIALGLRTNSGGD